MFIISITYKDSLENIDKHLNEHRAFLEQGYQHNYFIVSGRKKPRTGGIILSQLKDCRLLEEFIKSDPFYKNDLAQYEIIEFLPGAYHPNFSSFI